MPDAEAVRAALDYIEGNPDAHEARLLAALLSELYVAYRKISDDRIERWALPCAARPAFVT